jgi:dienelactone hydrolase
MHASAHIYYHDDQSLHGFLAYDDASGVKRPAVLIVHDWGGQNAFVRDKAQAFAAQGYIGFAVDMYGEGQTGQTTEEKQALMKPLVNDRVFLQQRILAALDAIRALSMVDTSRIAVIGFCFGGLCALDLARSGAPITAAVSFHGLLNEPENSITKPIQASICVFHGHDDPMVSPEHVNTFCQEMTDAQVDWQLHTYSQTQHAFMVPEANNLQLGTIYQPRTAHRAWEIFTLFLTERFQTS